MDGLEVPVAQRVVRGLERAAADPARYFARLAGSDDVALAKDWISFRGMPRHIVKAGRTEMSGVSRFTAEEKAEIILLCLRNPDKISEICREKGVAPVTYTKWRRRYISGGIDAISRTGNTQGQDLRIKNEKLEATVEHLYVELLTLKKNWRSENEDVHAADMVREPVPENGIGRNQDGTGRVLDESVEDHLLSEKEAVPKWWRSAREARQIRPYG